MDKIFKKINSSSTSNLTSSAFMPIGSTVTMSVGGVDKYIAPDETEWLRTGIVDTDVENYPVQHYTYTAELVPRVGIPTALVDLDTNLPIYVRVK